MTAEHLRVGLAEITPVWLDREATIGKVVSLLDSASCSGAELVVFGEALVPGYPFWLERTDGARFDSEPQKELFSRYSAEAVTIEDGHLDPVCDAAARQGRAVYLGVVERPRDRSGHSLYCSLVFIDASGSIRSVHRKLQPTYEERLVWAAGDGHGLQTHRVGSFTVGGLNCWENWMPLARAALQALGEDLHVAVWPGSRRNTAEITRFMAVESRSFVVSVTGRMSTADIPANLPGLEAMISEPAEILADGGSCVAAPDGSWVVEPGAIRSEGVHIVGLDPDRVRRERHNFDPAGHYSRPDVLRLIHDNRRQSTIERRSIGEDS